MESLFMQSMEVSFLIESSDFLLNNTKTKKALFACLKFSCLFLLLRTTGRGWLLKFYSSSHNLSALPWLQRNLQDYKYF